MNVVKFEDGHCKRIRSYLDSFLNNELMVETNHEVLTHLETCGACSRTLEDRARLKAQLKHAVMQEYAPAALRERIASDLRRGRVFSFNRASPALAAAAAVLVIAAVTFFTWGPPKNQLSLQAKVAPADVTGQILKIGFDDHVFCAIDHQLANKQFTPDQMSEKLGPEYVGLVELVKEKMPQDFTVVVGHRCHYQGREFIHLIMRNQYDVVSLVITRKNGEAFPTDGVASLVQATGGPIYQAAWANQQVAGLETRDHLVFVVSNKTNDTNMQIASSLEPSVRDFLARLES
ncbi:MAG TPA: zf-HC2 domain-containing protein [Blastocatellia bacterium]|nr:zf-HC2 domain-containing protein [Blastocatellia bacterium]